MPAQPHSGAVAGTGGWGGLGNRDRPFGASGQEERSRPRPPVVWVPWKSNIIVIIYIYN